MDTFKLRFIGITTHIVLCSGLASAQSAVWTQHNDNGRTGNNTSETILTPAGVTPNSFGKLFSYTLDDQTYSQPLYVPKLRMSVDGQMHNVVFVTTVNNSVYAWDADNSQANGGQPLWMRHLAPNGGRPPNTADMDSIGACSGNYNDFAGNMGIVGTPVIDLALNSLYFVSRTVESGVFRQRLYSLDLRSGVDLTGSPMEIQASYSGTVFDTTKTSRGLDPGQTASPTQVQNQRAALALVNGVVYIAWSSHCDRGDYHGWVMGYRADNLQQTTAWNDTPFNDNGGNMAGIWQAGQGATADGDGHLYFMTGNGHFDGVRNFSDSAIQLSTNATGALSLSQFFRPFDYDPPGQDVDFGSAGPVLIPGTTLLVGGGKTGMLFVMDTMKMGGIAQQMPNHDVQEFQAVTAQNNGYSHIHGGPVFFDGGPSSQFLYVWGENDFLRAFQYQNPLNAYAVGRSPDVHQAVPIGGVFNSQAVAHSTMISPLNGNGMPGGFLSLSSNGKTGGILWALVPRVCNANQEITPGALLAMDPVNFAGSGTSRTLKVLWDSTQNTVRDDPGYYAKYTYPTVANGKVYVSAWGPVIAGDNRDCPDNSGNRPRNTGQLVVYGLLGNRLHVTSTLDPASESSTSQQMTVHFHVTDEVSHVVLPGATIQAKNAAGAVVASAVSGPGGDATLVYTTCKRAENETIDNPGGKPPRRIIVREVAVACTGSAEATNYNPDAFLLPAPPPSFTPKP